MEDGQIDCYHLFKQQKEIIWRKDVLETELAVFEILNTYNSQITKHIYTSWLLHIKLSEMLGIYWTLLLPQIIYIIYTTRTTKTRLSVKSRNSLKSKCVSGIYQKTSQIAWTSNLLQLLSRYINTYMYFLYDFRLNILIWDNYPRTVIMCTSEFCGVTMLICYIHLITIGVNLLMRLVYVVSMYS